jgi:hypothetical protein
VESMPFTRLLDVHAEVANNPARDHLYEGKESPLEDSNLLPGWQVLLCTRGIGVDEAWSGM